MHVLPLGPSALSHSIQLHVVAERDNPSSGRSRRFALSGRLPSTRQGVRCTGGGPLERAAVPCRDGAAVQIPHRAFAPREIGARSHPRRLPSCSLTTNLAQSVTSLLVTLAAFAALVLSVLAHEVGHLLLLRHAGVPVRRILLYVFGGACIPDVDPRDTAAVLEYERRMLSKPFAAAGIYVAGPAVNLAIAALLWPAVEAIRGASPAASSAWVDIERGAYYVLVLNLLLGVFNLFPLQPLDGGVALFYVLTACAKPRIAQAIMFAVTCAAVSACAYYLAVARATLLFTITASAFLALCLVVSAMRLAAACMAPGDVVHVPLGTTSVPTAAEGGSESVAIGEATDDALP